MFGGHFYNFVHQLSVHVFFSHFSLGFLVLCPSIFMRVSCIRVISSSLVVCAANISLQLVVSLYFV